MHLKLIFTLLLFWLPTVEARYGIQVAKVGLRQSPNWFTVIVFSAGAIYMLYLITESIDDYKLLQSDEAKKSGFLTILFLSVVFIVCVIAVINAF